MNTGTHYCAEKVLETVPMMMRFIRKRMRANRETGLGIPAFRALLFVFRNEGTSLRDLADHLGLTPPSASKLVDGLIEQALVKRESSAEDRRRITLSLTSKGRRLHKRSYDATCEALSGKLAVVADDELSIIIQAMEILKKIDTGESGSTSGQ